MRFLILFSFALTGCSPCLYDNYFKENYEGEFAEMYGNEWPVIIGCKEVCANSDGYDPDMGIVRSCSEILKNYDGKGCFADDE